MHLIILEDNVDGLYPFSVLHATWELRYGPLRLVEQWSRGLDVTSMSFVGRTDIIASFTRRFPDYKVDVPNGRVVAIRSSLIPSHAIIKVLQQQLGESGISTFVLRAQGRVVAISCDASQFLSLNLGVHELDVVDLTSFHVIDVDAHVVTDLWQALDLVAETLRTCDTSAYRNIDAVSLRAAAVYCVKDSEIYVGSGIELAPLCVLDASQGPIILGNNVRIMSHAVIMGPCFIGDHTTIKAGAKIYPNTIIGEWCKVGGEVENSIIHAYSNKQHEGFLGHSFLSEWVNLGADTNTSDLKNTYGPIRVTRRGVAQDTGRMFLGLLCGDHTKSGIDTMFSTGTVCGIHSNVFGAGYTPSEIQSYSWGAVNDHRVYPARKAIAVARTVMQRRNRQLSDEEESLMKQHFLECYPGSVY